MFSIGNYMLFKYMYRFKGTTHTGIKNLLLFNEGVKLLFRPPVVPLIYFLSVVSQNGFYGPYRFYAMDK